MAMMKAAVCRRYGPPDVVHTGQNIRVDGGLTRSV